MEERQPEIWIVRHGETEWSRARRHTGRTDVPLTVAGARQAAGLRRWLGGRGFARVLSSPLVRALETCRLAGYGEQVQISDDLLEWDYGAYEGRTTGEIQQERPGWTIWAGSVPGGETLEQVSARAGRVIALAAAVPGDMLIFAHGHLLRVLTAGWLELPAREGRRFALEAASIGVLGYERADRVIRAWNPAGA